MDRKYPPPMFDFVIEKDDDGSYTAALVMSGIPNKRLANLSMKWMKEAMNDQITKLMGKLAMTELDEKQKEKTQ